MHAALPDVLPESELPSLAWHEEQLAARCRHCEPWPEEVGDPDWVRALEAEANAEPVLWATPGVTGLGHQPDALPSVSLAVAALQEAVARVVAVDPTGVTATQALVDAEALLGVQQQLQVHSISRIADVGRRGLQALVGFSSLRSWLRARRPDGDSTDAALALKLRDYPQLQAAVEAHRVSLSATRKLIKALGECWSQLDRPDGSIDGQPGDQVLPAVVSNAIGLVCRHLSGLEDDDPRLAALIEHGRKILDDDRSQRSQVEAIMLLLAEHLPPGALTGALQELLAALSPGTLDDAAAKGHANRDLVFTRKPDGSGWHVRGDLDLECGERLFTALRAEANRDPDNPADTLAWQKQREHETADNPFTGEPALSGGTVPDPGAPLWFEALDERLAPRRKGQRMHDALSRLLGRYLEHGLGGVSAKLPVQVAVTITEQRLTDQPGAAPARADSGALIPAAMVKRWWCDSSVTAFVLSLGGKALRAVHAQRTLTALERQALKIETGGRCAADGCCPEKPDPLVTLIPHHAQLFSKNGSTSLGETLAFCLTSHQDLHEGKRTILLRDGRYLNESGFTETPPWAEPPPF